jgi:hypothetical protein
MILELLAPFLLMMMESKDFKTREAARTTYTIFVCKYGTYKHLLYGAKPLKLSKRQAFERIEADVWNYISDGKVLPTIAKFPNFSYFPKYRPNEIGEAINKSIHGPYSVCCYEAASYFYIQILLEKGVKIDFIKLQVLQALERS